MESIGSKAEMAEMQTQKAEEQLGRKRGGSVQNPAVYVSSSEERK